MARSPKFVILDLNHLSGPEVTAVYGPFTERSSRHALAKLTAELKAQNSLQRREIRADQNGAVTIVDGLGTVRELKLIGLNSL